MKKIFFPILSLLASAILFSCNPLDELYDELDAAKGPYNEKHVVTLADADYILISDVALANASDSIAEVHAGSIKSRKFFTKEVMASEYIPNYLGETYPALNEGSQFTITYKYSFEDTIMEHNEWVLSDADYVAFDLDTNYFTATAAARDSIRVALDEKAVTQTFTEDDIYYVTYNVKISGIVKDTSELFVFSSGAWGFKTTYTLTDEDYDSMNGLDGTGPGAYSNFSSSLPHENYIPTLYKLKYPYANAGEKIYTIFNQYFGGDLATKKMVTIYHYDGTRWNNYKNNTEEFVRNASNWVFSPITKITMKKEDYQWIVEYIQNHSELNVYMDENYDNTEYYYGASSYYDNFDMRISKRKDNDPLGLLEGMSDEEITVEIWNRVYEAIDLLLESKYPTAQATINGAQVYYQVSIHTYEPGHYYYYVTYKVTETGTFELFQEKVAL